MSRVESAIPVASDSSLVCVPGSWETEVVEGLNVSPFFFQFGFSFSHRACSIFCWARIYSRPFF
ncbi:hypothetical protein, partial [Parabacteroides distasonis]|uniref:hypothetical protein n=1 Tax=Parabacteroides distasonis TaxID=823 RepID=UPI00325AE481